MKKFLSERCKFCIFTGFIREIGLGDEAFEVGSVGGFAMLGRPLRTCAMIFVRGTALLLSIGF